MNYIMFDLEWNQAAYKYDEEEELPFEIIEIGAVKFSDSGEKLDDFSALIKPQVYPFLVRKTREITGLSDADLDEYGVDFEDACELFLEWCGEDYIFGTFGTLDLPQLQKNMAYYGMEIPWTYPLKYIDVQKLYALEHNEGKQRKTLSHLIELLQIPIDRSFHRAIDDAEYTGRVFFRLNREKYESFFSIDYYNLPKSTLEEETFYFDTYSKMVTKRYDVKEELLASRKLKETPCFVCRKKLKREVPWFSDGVKNHYALARCPEHGMMKCRIRVKYTDDNIGYFGVRTIKVCTPENEDAVRTKKQNIKDRRRGKKHGAVKSVVIKQNGEK